ncbi:E3 ubiquitin-protein ligase makorin-like [Chenopodium quinoa]|uniref:E3 ubiquitin-protein ligase makorin-like n=1 Tax=Chenopodium quinoa TaxID=63459 RepID=UPI000B792E99|nr:E3 ubiquitin-protein ligase makorin-like [Chenopodium quinoa]
MLDFRDFWVKYLATNSYVPSLERSKEIECSVCLERVLAKTAASERKFGLLSESDHPFCITCIRFWRNSSPTSGMDVNSTLRACPICRNSYSGITEIAASFSLYCI